jgi:hypothetical protein
MLFSPGETAMKKTQHSALPKAVSSVEGSTRHSPRRGSILILVIALLVMLALIGTAFISTTRIDRTAAAQGTANVETDLFTASVQNLAVNSIVNDMFAAGPLHSPDPFVSAPAANSILNPVTSPVSSTFLASRVPTNPAGAPQWEWISNPLSDGTRFEDPTAAPGSNLWGGTVAPNDRAGVQITSKPIGGNNYPALISPSGTFVAGDADGDGIADCGLVRLGSLPGPQFAGITWYYGVRIIDGNSAINASTAWTMGNDGTATAATAEAGTAGATLRNNRLTPASIGLREMLSAPGELDYPTGLGTGLTLNAYRFNGIQPSSVAANPPLADYDNSTTQSNAALFTPITRADFAFQSQLDAFWQQLGSRPGFPGYSFMGTIGGQPTRFQALSDSDTAALAYRFCLANPSNSLISASPSTAYTGAPSIIEQKLHTDLYSISSGLGIPTVPTTPYTANGSSITAWFNNNFNYTGGSMPRRALIVGRNPVVNVAGWHTPMPISAKENFAVGSVQFTPDSMSYPNVSATTGTEIYVNRGAWQGGVAYNQGDVVQSTNFTQSPPTDSRTYVCVAAHTSIAGSPPTNASPWRPQDFNIGSPKVNVNTASFNDLWRAYWNVMVNNISKTAYSPFDDAGGSPLDPATGSPVAINGTFAYFGNSLVGPQVQHPERMFRSILRGPSAAGADPFLSSQDMVLLRSAIAAANAEHMRDYSQNTASDTIKVHTIALKPNNIASTTIQADVYATGIQPFITEVYFSGDIETGHNPADVNAPGNPNPTGYIAIELYNPYNVGINLNNWALITHDRGATTGTPWATFTAGATTPPNLYVFGQNGNPTGIIIPAHGYMILDNLDAGSTNGARHRTTPTGLPATAVLTPTSTPPVVDIPDLAQVIGHELILLRPLDGTIGGNTMISALPAQVPVDSFDFTGFTLGTTLVRTGTTPDPASPPATAFEYYYCRSTNEGQAVYPGHYNGTGAGPHEEVVSISYEPAQMIDDPANPAGPKIERDNPDPWAGGILTSTPPGTANVVQLTTGGRAGPYTASFGAANTTSTTNLIFTIQLGGVGAGTTANLSGFGGPNTIAAGANHYPFGSFMREGDLLQIPFIGAYVIYDKNVLTTPPAGHGATDTALAALYEINSVSMDSAFADDTDKNDDLEENVGRFCPIVPAYPIPAAGTALTDISEFAGKPQNLRYGWASRVFDYLTVRGNPRLPDANPTAYTAKVTARDVQPAPQSADAARSNPMLTSQSSPTIDGLININTAPAEVLRLIPWVNADSSNSASLANATAANKLIANAIVKYRTGKYGTTPLGAPNDHMNMTAGTTRYFHNLFELNKVIDTLGAGGNASLRTNGFTTGGTWGTESSNPDTSATFSGVPTFKTHDNGDFSPLTPANFFGAFGTTNEGANDQTANDFESQFLQLTAVSNLITTRSDTFTVYIVVEGWTNTGTSNATRVAQRRLAFLVDRTGVTSTNNRVVKITPVPTD